MKRPFFARAKIKPKYDPHHQFKRFETRKDAERTSQFRIRVLREWLLKDREDIESDREAGLLPRCEAVRRRRKEAKELLQKLKNCRRKAECGSPACPVCRRRYRRWFCSEFLKLADGRDFWFLTYIPKEGPQSLETFKIKTLGVLKNRLFRRFERKLPGTAEAVGTLDLLKVRLDGTIEPHFHVLVMGCTHKELSDVKIDKRKRKRGRKEKSWNSKPKAKRRRGAPWRVDTVMPSEWMDAVSYFVREKPRNDEVESSKLKWRIAPVSKEDKDSYFAEHIRPKYQELLVQLT